jgi:hypothetical protein
LKNIWKRIEEYMMKFRKLEVRSRDTLEKLNHILKKNEKWEK